MNKKKGIILALALLLGCGAFASTLAYFSDSKLKENTITMGNVGIELTEPEFEKNENSTIENVMPAQSIVKDPTITVNTDSNDAYARAKIEIVGLNDVQTAELEAGIAINEGWAKAADGYYYYNTKLTGGDVVKVFETVVIPETWGNEIGKLTIKINVTAEAIQADNFTPTVVDGFITAWNDSKGEAVTLTK